MTPRTEGHLAIGTASVSRAGVGAPLTVARLTHSVSNRLLAVGSLYVAAHQAKLSVVIPAVSAAGHMSVKWDCRCPELSTTLITK